MNQYALKTPLKAKCRRRRFRPAIIGASTPSMTCLMVSAGNGFYHSTGEKV
jgi:hypothetical protein